MSIPDKHDNPTIAWTIMTGNPVQGLSLHGLYDSPLAASEAASGDTTMPADWWVLPIYPMTEE
jgi:hypothetical protein